MNERQKKLSRVVEILHKDMGVSIRLAHSLVKEYEYLVKENDEAEFGAQKIYSLEFGYEKIVTEKSTIIECIGSDIDVLMKRLLGILQTKHARKSINAQAKLMKMKNDIRKICLNGEEIFNDDDV